MPSSPGSSSFPEVQPLAVPPVAGPRPRSVAPERDYVRLSSAQLRLRVFVRACIVSVTLAGAALAIVLYARDYARHPQTDNAYVQADIVRIAPRVSGPVVRLPVRDNQRVSQGDLLIQIDPTDFEVRLEEARAQLAVADAQVDQAGAAIAQADASVEENDQRVSQANAQALRARQDFDRAAALMKSERKAISQQELDAARAGTDAANANLDAAKAGARSSRASAQAAHANLAAAEAQRRRAAASVHDAELQLSYTRIVAPVDGWVTNLNLPPGNYLTAGQSPLAMVADHTWRVTAYYKETVTARMRPGQSVKVRLFPYPDKVFAGTVQGIGWGIHQADGTANAATLQLPDVSPTINWVRLAQRFPVRIDLPTEDALHPFRIGQTAVVEIDIDEPPAPSVDSAAPGAGSPPKLSKAQ